MRGVNRIFISLLISLVVSLLLNVHAKGEAGAQFLKMGVEAKACAMGEAFVGVADDATAIYWNPAGLTQIKSVELLGMQNFYLMDMGYQYLSAVLPSRYRSLGVAIAYSSSGEIPRYENFQQLGEYTAYDVDVTIAYADRLNKAISYGIALKMIQQKIEEEKATGFAADIGLLYKVGFIKGMKIGLVAQNFGPKIKFIKESDPLPQNVKVGIGYNRGPFTFATDLVKPSDNDLRFSLGGEFLIGDILALRTGYNSSYTYSAGLGLTWKRISIDYAYVPYGDLGDTHRISFLIKSMPIEEVPAVVTPPLLKEVPIVIQEKRPEVKIPEIQPTVKPEVKHEIKPEEKPLSIIPEKPSIKPPVLLPKIQPPVEVTPKEVVVPQREIIVVIDEVVIWLGPGNTYEKLTTVRKGTKLILLDDSKRWYYKVLLPDRTVGWVCYAFVR